MMFFEKCWNICGKSRHGGLIMTNNMFWWNNDTWALAMTRLSCSSYNTYLFLLISFFFPKGYKFLWRDWEEISLFPLYDTKQIILWSRIRTMPYTKITLMWIHLFDIPMTFIMCIKDETNDIVSQSSSFFLIYKYISITLLLLLDLFHLYSDMHNQIDQSWISS